MPIPNDVMLTVIERARRYVAKCPPAISGQAGHDATFHVACVLVNGFAFGEPDALALLREWNQSCLPPWSVSLRMDHGMGHAGVMVSLVRLVEGM